MQLICVVAAYSLPIILIDCAGAFYYRNNTIYVQVTKRLMWLYHYWEPEQPSVLDEFVPLSLPRFRRMLGKCGRRNIEYHERLPQTNRPYK